jgi:hypothetical protein
MKPVRKFPVVIKQLQTPDNEPLVANEGDIVNFTTTILLIR